jgi:hypothetical protein
MRSSVIAMSSTLRPNGTRSGLVDYSRRLKSCFPESSSSGRLLSDDMSAVWMSNLGGQL